MLYPETTYGVADCYGPNSEKVTAKNVEIVGMFPTPETTEENKYIVEQRYRALAFTYGVAMQIVHSPSEIIVSKPIICIQEHNRDIDSIYYKDYKFTQEKYMLIVGNSNFRYPSDYFKDAEVLHIPTPCLEPLYGDQALAIVLQHSYSG
jgi:hypothetical protein